MNAKQRRTWYRALRPTMQAIVLHGKVMGILGRDGTGYAEAALGLVDWGAGDKRWDLTRDALRTQRRAGMVWNAKR